MPKYHIQYKPKRDTPYPVEILKCKNPECASMPFAWSTGIASKPRCEQCHGKKFEVINTLQISDPKDNPLFPPKDPD